MTYRLLKGRQDSIGPVGLWAAVGAARSLFGPKEACRVPVGNLTADWRLCPNRVAIICYIILKNIFYVYYLISLCLYPRIAIICYIILENIFYVYYLIMVS